jgi:hypothetical protein
MGGGVAMRYEIEVHYRGYLPRWTVIEADSDFEAREIAKTLIEAMVVPREECVVTVLGPGGLSETFEPGEV